MRHAQKLIALLLAVTLICGVCLAVTGTTVQDTGAADASPTSQLLTLSTVFTFSDVPADTWYADAVAYVSSAGLRALLIGQKTAGSKRAAMELTHVAPAVKTVLDTVGFTKILTLR